MYIYLSIDRFSTDSSTCAPPPPPHPVPPSSSISFSLYVPFILFLRLSQFKMNRPPFLFISFSMDSWGQQCEYIAVLSAHWERRNGKIKGGGITSECRVSNLYANNEKKIDGEGTGVIPFSSPMRRGWHEVISLSRCLQFEE